MDINTKALPTLLPYGPVALVAAPKQTYSNHRHRPYITVHYGASLPEQYLSFPKQAASGLKLVTSSHLWACHSPQLIPKNVHAKQMVEVWVS